MASYSELKQQAMAAEKAAIEAAIAETKTLDEAARKLGVSRRTLQNRMTAHKLKKGKAGRRKKPLAYGRKGWTVEFAAVDLPDDAKLGEMSEEKTAIVNALREHPTVAATAQALRVTRATLQKRMRDYGLPEGKSGRRKKPVGQKKEALSIKKTPEAARSETLEAVTASPTLAVATEAVLGVGAPTGLFAAKPSAQPAAKPARQSQWNKPEVEAATAPKQTQTPEAAAVSPTRDVATEVVLGTRKSGGRRTTAGRGTRKSGGRRTTAGRAAQSTVAPKPAKPARQSQWNKPEVEVASAPEQTQTPEAAAKAAPKRGKTRREREIEEVARAEARQRKREAKEEAALAQLRANKP